ncbi:hypothetical protein ABIA35_008693 [Catenulispora sp. MAP12-49]|uniref:hypothetical protein n=1 Tax=unclassified Catenulispora TaxID=414885 RepID=UPI0035196B8B
MSEFQLGWTLSGTGWVDCTVTGLDVRTVIVASFVTTAPRDVADIGYPQQEAAVDA